MLQARHTDRLYSLWRPVGPRPNGEFFYRTSQHASLQIEFVSLWTLSGREETKWISGNAAHSFCESKILWHRQVKIFVCEPQIAALFACPKTFLKSTKNESSPQFAHCWRRWHWRDLLIASVAYYDRSMRIGETNRKSESIDPAINWILINRQRMQFFNCFSFLHADRFPGWPISNGQFVSNGWFSVFVWRRAE